MSINWIWSYEHNYLFWWNGESFAMWGNVVYNPSNQRFEFDMKLSKGTYLEIYCSLICHGKCLYIMGKYTIISGWLFFLVYNYDREREQYACIVYSSAFICKTLLSQAPKIIIKLTLNSLICMVLHLIFIEKFEK